MTKQHLLVDLSSHGFGHFAQTSMVLNALHIIEPTLKITIRGTLPEAIIQERLSMPVTYIQHSLDIGMKMHNAVVVDAEASYEYYQDFHENYQSHLDAEIELLESISPDLLLANVPYISLSAAKVLTIPSIVMCSLNWAGIFESFCKKFPESDRIIMQIRRAYSTANYFLMATPHMPMIGLNNTKPIPPIAHIGSKKIEVLKRYVNNPKAKFVLVSLGGIPTQLDTAQWPQIDNVFWMVGDGIASDRKDVIANKALDLSFIDLLTSCDAIITKTGYGTLVEAVASQTPVICVERGNWPEEPALFDWVSENGYLQVLDMKDLEVGDFAQQVEQALDVSWEKEPVNCDGAEVAAKIIRSNLPNQMENV
jgi:hypothetical protein